MNSCSKPDTLTAFKLDWQNNQNISPLWKRKTLHSIFLIANCTTLLKWGSSLLKEPWERNSGNKKKITVVPKMWWCTQWDLQRPYQRPIQIRFCREVECWCGQVNNFLGELLRVSGGSLRMKWLEFNYLKSHKPSIQFLVRMKSSYDEIGMETGRTAL